MNKTISKKLLAAFEVGGVVDNCISWLRHEYKLGLYDEIEQKLPEYWQNYHDIELPKQIRVATKEFDDSVVRGADNLFMEEVEANLRECQTVSDKENYIFSLLRPFSNYSDFCDPTLNMANSRTIIDEYSNRLKEKRKTKIGNEEKDSIDYCINENERLIERYADNNKRLFEVFNLDKDHDSVESCFIAFRRIATTIAHILDASLLRCNIDYMKLQNESGVKLKEHRLPTDLEPYLGSMTMVTKYLNELPKKQKEIIEIAPQFKTKLTDEQREKLYRVFTAKNSQFKTDYVIAKDTDKQSFLWALGGLDMPSTFVKIDWLQNRQFLREFLEFVCVYDHNVRGETSFTKSVAVKTYDIFGVTLSKSKNRGRNFTQRESMSDYLSTIITD